MPPRKAAGNKGDTQLESAEQNGHAGSNSEVAEGRSLRVRKRVDYNEDPRNNKKDDSGNSQKGGKKGKKSPLDSEFVSEDVETGVGSSQDGDSDTEMADSTKKTSRKTVAKKGSSKTTLNETFIVKKTNKRIAKTDKKPEEEEIEPETKKTKAKSEKVNETNTDYSKITFENSKKTTNGEECNFKMTSWNVDGLRAWLKKDGAKFLEHENPDILCLQETKCSDEKVPAEAKFEGYHSYWASSERDGYSGVALFSKEEPINVKYGMGIEEHDTEGRLITAEYDKFYFVTTYVPNAGKGLVTLPKRLSWNAAFKQYLKELDSKKPVVLCGDMNVSHQEIDLANPKTNTKNAGFTKEERDGMTELLAEGFIDTFRHFYPKETGAYTFWTYMRGARSRNIGWRLDYFIVSERIIDQVCDIVNRDQVLGSDHCPITLLFHKK